MTAAGAADARLTRKQLWRAIRARHPPLRVALPADARITAMFRGERHEFRSRADTAIQIARLALVSDGFLGQMLYRVKARLQGLGIPLAPRIAHRLAMATGQVAIGDPVVMHPGVYIIHGQIVIDGAAEIHSNVVIAPFTVIGLREGGGQAATIESGASIGTGAKLLGPVRIGADARVGANAVVLADVAPATTVVGAPARPIGGPAGTGGGRAARDGRG